MTPDVVLLAAGLVALIKGGGVMAQAVAGAYYYCYAYSDGGVFVSDSVRYGSAADYRQSVQIFVSTVRARPGVSIVTASGCRAVRASLSREAVEAERIGFIGQERRRGRPVSVVRWWRPLPRGPAPGFLVTADFVVHAPYRENWI